MREPPRGPREAHGPVARLFMVTTGLVILLPFGSLGGFIAMHARAAASVPSALSDVACSGLLLALASYGAWLAWRGLRGYSRPTTRTQRLLLGVAWVFAASGAAGIVSSIVTVFTVGPVVIQHASLHSIDGSAWLIAVTSMALPIQLAAHELGHVLAGRWVGFGFVSVQVGPYCLDRHSGRWRVAWQPLQLGLGGRATVVFDGSHRLPERTAIFAAGGPAANLVLALVAGFAAAAAPRPETSSAAIAVGLLRGCTVEGVFLCLFNLVPLRGTGTDGARILNALRRPTTPDRRS